MALLGRIFNTRVAAGVLPGILWIGKAMSMSAEVCRRGLLTGATPLHPGLRGQGYDLGRPGVERHLLDHRLSVRVPLPALCMKGASGMLR